jgi:hypothetical protein
VTDGMNIFELRVATIVREGTEPHGVDDVEYCPVRRLCGSLISDERVICIRHDAVAAVRR